MKEKRTRRKSVTITFDGRHRESQQHASEFKEEGVQLDHFDEPNELTPLDLAQMVQVRRDGALLVDSKSGSPIKPIPGTVVGDPFRTSYPAFQVGTGGPFPGSIRRSSLVSVGSGVGLTLTKRGSMESRFSLTAPDTTLLPWILTIVSALVISTQIAFLVFYWTGYNVIFQSDVLGQAIWGGLLGFASGVAALVAMKTQSEDFPIFMICHATFALLSPMMCMLVVPVMCHTVISRAADEWQNIEHGTTVFLCTIFNILIISLMAIVGLIIFVTQNYKCCCSKKRYRTVNVLPF